MMIWILLSIVAGSLLINQLFLKRSLMSFRYYLEPLQSSAEIGETIDIHSVIENHKQLPVSHVELLERYPEGLGGAEYRTSMYVGGFERLKRRHQVVARERGVHEIQHGSLVIGDFIGLQRDYRRYPLHKSWVVYPEKINLHEKIVPQNDATGEFSVERWIMPDPIMIRGVREYTGNEPQKAIHWPSSLRHQQLMVREFDYTADQSVHILLNIQTAPPSWEKPRAELIENSIKIARGLAEELEAAGIPFGLSCNAYNYLDPAQRGYTVHTGLGEAHMLELLDMLGRIDYKLGRSFSGLLDQQIQSLAQQSTLVIVTPLLLAIFLEPIQILLERVARVVVITQTADLIAELPDRVEVYRGVA